MADIAILDKIEAVIRLRITLASRGLRRGQDISDLVSAVIMLLVGSIVSIGMAVLFAFLVLASVSSGDLKTLHLNLEVAFYLFFIIAIVLPILFQNLQIGIDTTRFRLYPISSAWLYAITVGSSFGSPEHLLYYPAFVAIYVAGVLPMGGGAAIGTSVMLLLLFSYVVLGSTIALVVQSIVRCRRARELLTIMIFLVLAVVWLTHFTFVHGWIRSSGPFARMIDYLRTMPAIWQFLPPEIAASTITSLHEGGMVPALHGILRLCLWVAVVTAIGYLVFSKLQHGEKGRKPKDIRAEKPRGTAGHTDGTAMFDLAGLLHLSAETCAVVTKELRYMMRSARGKGMMLLVPCITVVHALMIRETVKSAVMDIQPGAFGLFVVSMYITIVMGNYMCNSFQWERGGIQTYFTSPTPLATVIAGKNLGIAVYATLLFCISVVMYGIITGGLEPLTLAKGILIFANSTLTVLIVGNFLAIKYPVPCDASRMRSSLSQSAQLMLFLVLLGILVYLAAVVIVPFVLGVSALMLPLLLALLAFQAVMYRIALRSAARLMHKRRELLIHRVG